MTRGPLTISVQILGHAPHGSSVAPERCEGRRPVGGQRHVGRCGGGPCVSQGAAGNARLPRRMHWCGALTTPAHASSLASPRAESRARAMDLSDGLIGDLPKLAQASGLGAHVSVDQLPLSKCLRAVVDLRQARDWALAGGDDYELLLAVPPERFTEMAGAADRLNLTLTPIGELRAGAGVTLVAEWCGFRARRLWLRPLRPSLDPNHSLASAGPVSSRQLKSNDAPQRLGYLDQHSLK